MKGVKRVDVVNNKYYKYDFTFSFAGEDRMMVEPIKNKLLEQNYTIFYDTDFQHELVGKDLFSHLRKIYKDMGKYVVCFISNNYTNKIWTSLEFTAIKERLMSTFFASDFLIPIIIGNTNILDDIPSYIGFYKHKTVDETVELLINKFNSSLAEDNYFQNINNCIEYICNQVVKRVTNQGYMAYIENNTIVIPNTGRYFKFTTDTKMQIPCIVVFYMENVTPDLFISWNNIGNLLFNIHSFYTIKETSQKQSINSLVSYLGNYLLERIR